MKITLINAKTDLGVTVDGSNFGALAISKHFTEDNRIQKIIDIEKPIVKKEKEKENLAKNLNAVNSFNQELYQAVAKTKEEGAFPITLGGDHSLAIGSALGSIRNEQSLGIIWIDAHIDYNTFETTITGNLHGLPLAAIDGLNEKLSPYHNGIYYNPKNTVVVGYRSMEENKEIELNIIKKMGVTVFSTEDIRKMGIQEVIRKAVEIASSNTNGIHISYDLDVIDPEVAPGVSVPEINGISEKTAMEILKEVLQYKEKIVSFDVVELNPLNDINNKTEKIAVKIVDEIIKSKCQ